MSGVPAIYILPFGIFARNRTVSPGIVSPEGLTELYRFRPEGGEKDSDVRECDGENSIRRERLRPQDRHRVESETKALHRTPNPYPLRKKRKGREALASSRLETFGPGFFL